MEVKKYQSKLLLFGEYTAVLGGEILAIPLPRYSGHFKLLGDGPSARQILLSGQLKGFAGFLFKKDDGILDLPRLEAAVELYYFESDIPQGYGVGSSGALCAAIYDKFAQNKTSDIDELKAVFAAMESYFHGSSSGVDPLVAYLNSGLHLKGKNDFELVDVSMDFLEEAGFYLVDTKIPRKTQPLVDAFLENCKNPVYQNKCKEELAVYNQRAIAATLEGDREALRKNFQAISVFQFEYFQAMIPASFRAEWEKGLTSGDYAIKLCGAGGGGFLLGLKASRG